MAVEATRGFDMKKMVIYIDERVFPDPLLIGISKRFFISLEGAVKYLKNLAIESDAYSLHKLNRLD